MLECPKCHCQLENGNFCPECGTKLQTVRVENYCPACKCIVDKGKFCPECGTKLVAESDAIETAPVKQSSAKKAPTKKTSAKKTSAKQIPDQPVVEVQQVHNDIQAAYTLICQQRYAEAVRVLDPYVKKGDPFAQLYMADCYVNGWGVNVDMRKAYLLYKKSSEQGNPHATLCLGVFYERGDGGVKQNVSKALELYWQAHLLGDPQALAVYQNISSNPLVRINAPVMAIGKYYNGEPVVDIRSSVYGWNISGRYLVYSVVFYFVNGDSLEGPISADYNTPADCVLNGMLGSTRSLQTPANETTFVNNVFMIPCEQLWITGYKGTLTYLAHMEVCEILANGQPVGLGSADFEFSLERTSRFLRFPTYEIRPHF
jgi:hypothetical protein